jgi:uncharacterized membrane protein
MNEHISRTSKDMVDMAELFKRTWALFQSKPVEHLVAGLIVLALSIVSLGVLLGPLSVGQIRMIEKQQRGEDPRIEDVFAGFSSFAPAFLTTLFFFVVMTVGLMVLLLPGLFVAVAWGFALWFVALEGASASEALGASWQLLKDHTGSVLVVLIVMGVINAIASSVVLATLLTAPLTMIFCTLAFQEMVDRRSASEALPRN